MMRTGTPSAKPSRAATRPPASSITPPHDLPLSAVYADALYRPVPPVEYDDEGYPGPDGKMPESTRHRRTVFHGHMALETWFRDRPDTLVASDLLLLFEEGNREAALAPDLMVIFDAGNPDRLSYKVWEERDRMPAFALEVLSSSTWRRDVRIKPGLYAALGVRELWLFDPPEGCLVGHRLVGDAYERIEPRRGGGRPSRVLGLDVLVEDGELRFRNPATGEILPNHEEERRRREQAEARRDEERTRREQAERRVEELEALLARSG